MEPWIRRLREVAIPELEAVRWFENAGRPWPSPDNRGEQLFDWNRAAELGEARLQEHGRASAGLSTYISRHCPPYLSRPAATERGLLFSHSGEVEEEFNRLAWHILERAWAAGAEHSWWRDCFKRCVHGDIHGYAVYRAFDDVPEFDELPDFFPRAMEIYRAGHLPCGWTMPYYKWPRGDFIYI